MSQSHTRLRAAAGALCAAALVAALSITGCSGGTTSGGTLGGKTSLTESELDATIATYTYNGSTIGLTAREVILETSSLSSMQIESDDENAAPTYQVPAADSIISVARNKIVSAEADKQGITVNDDDLATYASDTLGTDDFDSIASSYSMEVDDVKVLLRESAQMSKLREQVVTDDAGEAPESPTEPEEGQEEVATADYAKYIIDLAGDEWDAENNAWKSEDGDYATALADYEITSDSATYEAAQSAYYVAYQQYSDKQSEVSQQWTDYVNGLLANASIAICTLVA